MKFFIIILLSASLLEAVPQNEGFVWNPIKIGKESFVPMAEVKRFYGFKIMDLDDNTLTLENAHLKMTFTVGGYVAVINEVKFLTAQPVRKQGEHLYLSLRDLTSLIDPILRPQRGNMFKKVTTVILDAGHGGRDKGAAGKESKLTLALALKIKPLLEKQGFKVVLTRNKDEFVPLAHRVHMANTHEDAVLVSLHFNSGNSRARGFESYILSAGGQGNNQNAASIALGVAIHSRALSFIDNEVIKDRGIRRAKFNVLNGCKHPSVLIEAGFLTNKEEAAMIATEEYQARLARSIAKGVEVYRMSRKK